MAGFERVINREAVEERFGEWPTFHDAEVLAVRLDSGQRSDGRASVELDIHAFEMTDQVDDDGYYVIRLHTMVTLRCEGTSEIELAYFGPQNVLAELGIDWLPQSSDGARFALDLPSNNGLQGSLRCEDVIVMSVAPYTPGPYSVYGGLRRR